MSVPGKNHQLWLWFILLRKSEFIWLPKVPTSDWNYFYKWSVPAYGWWHLSLLSLNLSLEDLESEKFCQIAYSTTVDFFEYSSYHTLTIKERILTGLLKLRAWIKWENLYWVVKHHYSTLFTCKVFCFTRNKPTYIVLCLFSVVITSRSFIGAIKKYWYQV